MLDLCSTSHLEAFERQTIPREWLPAEIADLFRLRVTEDREWIDVAKRLGRSESAVKSKFKYVMVQREVKAPSIPFVREPVPAAVLAGQRLRLAASARDLTGAICGDPPAGFSALDDRSASAKQFITLAHSPSANFGKIARA